MARLVKVLVVGLFMALVSVAAEVQKGCPYYNPVGWACAYRPQCMGSSSLCGAGHKCCPHPCGDTCVLTVHCERPNCTEACSYGYKDDDRGCPSCECRDSPRCTTLQCKLLQAIGKK